MTENSQIKVEHISTFDGLNIVEFNALRDKGTEWNEQQGKKFLANDDSALFLALAENHIVGFLTAYRLQRLDKKKAEVLLYEISVADNFRQRGIGKVLIGKLKEWASQIESDEVWVLTNRSNVAAIALYTSLGGSIESTDEQMFTFKM